MDASLNYYDTTRYDFSEDTWRAIFAYESKLKSHKILKKVNFKKGELASYTLWVQEFLNSSEFIRIMQSGISLANYSEYYSKEKAQFEKKLSNPYYLRNRLERALNDNKYVIEKVNRYGLRFSFLDVREFLAVLNEAETHKCLEDFLSIPDVWYIIRNIRKNWGLIVNKQEKLENLDYSVYL